MAAARPTFLVFEDLHWAEDALLAFLEHLAEWAEGVPLLLLCTARPELYERHSRWAARNATTINLAPLSDQETAALVSALLPQTVLKPEVERALLERAGGNPLFAEEFVRLLADRGHAPDGSSLPESVQALIAARLDTLAPERKSLLQDAAVLGKVFWAGALAEIGGREEGDVELALHELARKELVRPARASSMEGENEYSFWHVLVRDVAYGQIPRAERARRHRSAAIWVERKAGGRTEDFAEVLVYHYLQALELAEAVGDPDQVRELTRPARNVLALAGERALGLDTVQAEARLARALELTSSEDPERAELLVRWARAAFQAGRRDETVEALEQAVALHRAAGETEAAARALQFRARVSHSLGEGRHVEFAAEAVALLEHESNDRGLVEAYAQLAHSHFVAGSSREALAAADKALALAERLGLPEPARALSARGVARAVLGDRRGLAEMERALAMYVEEGAGAAAPGLQASLALIRYRLEGPAAALAAFEEGMVFCERRGLAEMATNFAAERAGLLVELGRTEEALSVAGQLARRAVARGGLTLTYVRAIELATRAVCGESAAPAEADWVAQTARQSGAFDTRVFGLAAAATALLAAGLPERARALLAELSQAEGAREANDYARQLPTMVRTALVAGDPALAKRLSLGLEPTYPLNQHALCSARAQLAERAGELGDAVTLYAEAAARWAEFGNVPERAYALLGQGRCLLESAQAGAEQPLRTARDLFDSMGYRPALAATEELLEQTAAPAS